MQKHFESKSEARTTVWDTLQDAASPGFRSPPHGRIPNFEGAQLAAKKLFQVPLLSGSECIKVNPDAPQRYVRIEALRRGCTVYVPTPRLKGGFKRLDPQAIPDDKLKTAASLSNMYQWADIVPLDDLPQLDAIVTGSVAVTRKGRRCGKGEGYSDLEYAILQELGHDPGPVATTVHSIQVVESIPRDRHDLPLSLFAKPDETVSIESPPPRPKGIDWTALSNEDLNEMPVLRELWERKR